MAITDTNPYALQDISILIQEYSNPLADQQPAPEAQAFGGPNAADLLAAFPYWLKNQGGNSSYAALSNRLQQTIDQARGAVETLYSYGTGVSGPSVEIDVPGFDNVNIRNTWYTMAKADNAGQAVATLVADCIPCKDRVIALLNLNPMEDLWNNLTAMYDQCFNFLYDLFDLAFGNKSMEAIADLCSLFNFLSFMCLPDLAAQIMLLSRMITKYAIELKDIDLSIMSIMGKITGPALTPLWATIEKYFQLIVAPIECVVAAMDAELQKADVIQAYKRSFGKNPNAERTFSLNSIAGPMRNLKKYLEDGMNDVKEELKKIDESMRDFLGIQKEIDKQTLDISHHIEMCQKFIGLIQAIMIALIKGNIVCGPDKPGEEDVANFTKNYISSQNDLDIVLEDGAAVIRGKLPDNIGKLLNVMATYNKEREKKNLPTTEQLMPAPIVVPFKNCLYTTTDEELSKVKDMLGSFK